MPYCERVASAEEAAYALTKKKFSKGKDFPHPPLADSWQGLGEVLVHLGRNEPAIKHLRVAAKIRQTLFDDHEKRAKNVRAKDPREDPLMANLVNPGRDLATTWLYLGMAHEGLDQPAEAAAHYRKAVDLFRKEYPKGSHALAAALTFQAGYLARTEKHEDAKRAYAEAAAIMGKVYPAQQFPDGHPALAYSEFLTGRLLVVRGKYAEALPPLRRAFDYLQKHVERFTTALSESEAITYQQELPAVRAELRNKDSKAGPVWKVLIVTRRRLSRALQSGGEDAAAHRRLLKSLTERKEELESQLAALILEVARQEKLANSTPADLRDKLPAGSAFVDLVRYETGRPRRPHYLAFVLAKGQPIQCVELGGADLIEKALSSWRHALDGGGDHPEAALALRRLLWAPIARSMPRGTRTVYMAPDGELALLPWAALPGAKADEILLHDYEGGIGVVPHGQFLLGQLQSIPPAGGFDHFLAVGDVTYDSPGKRAAKESDYKPIRGTADELADLKKIAKGWGHVELRGRDATAGRLLEELPKADGIHIATHGVFKTLEMLQERQKQQALLRFWEFRSGSTTLIGRGLRSPLAYVGLAFAGVNDPARAGPEGGIVSGEMLIDLPLERARLVVLSACNTGVGTVRGRAEGIQSLQSAFHLAGARNVVASLWVIPDH